MDWSISEDPPDDMDWEISQDPPDDMDWEILLSADCRVLGLRKHLLSETVHSIRKPPPQERPTKRQRLNTSNTAVGLARPPAILPAVGALVVPHQQVGDVIVGAAGETLANVAVVEIPIVLPAGQQEPSVSNIVQVESEDYDKTQQHSAMGKALAEPSIAASPVEAAGEQEESVAGGASVVGQATSALGNALAEPSIAAPHVEAAGQQEENVAGGASIVGQATSALGNALAEPSIAAPHVEAAGEHEKNVAGGASVVGQATRQQELLDCDDFVQFESLDDDNEVYQDNSVLNLLVEPSTEAPEIDLGGDEVHDHPKEDATLPTSPAISLPHDLAGEDSNPLQVEEEPPTIPPSSARPRRVKLHPCRRSTRIILAALKSTGSLYSTSGKRRSARLLTRLNAGI